MLPIFSPGPQLRVYYFLSGYKAKDTSNPAMRCSTVFSCNALMNSLSLSTKSGKDCSIASSVILSQTRSLALRMTVLAPFARVPGVTAGVGAASVSILVL